MSDNYVVQADAAYAYPASGGAVLLYKGAPFPADSSNLDLVVANGLVVPVADSFEAGGIANDIPDQPAVPDSKVVKPGPAVKQAAKQGA